MWRTAVLGPEIRQLAGVPKRGHYNHHQPFEVLPNHSRRMLKFFEVFGWSTSSLFLSSFSLFSPSSVLSLSLSPPLLANLMEGIRKEMKRERWALVATVTHAPSIERWRAKGTIVYFDKCSVVALGWHWWNCVPTQFSVRQVPQRHKWRVRDKKMKCAFMPHSVLGMAHCLSVICRQISYRLINLVSLWNEVGKGPGTTEPAVNLLLYVFAKVSGQR